MVSHMYLHTHSPIICRLTDTQKGSHMSHNTPEERACQATTRGITPETLNTILAEVGATPITTPVSKVIDACNQSTDSPAKQKSIAESKKLIENFKEKLSNYPKHLSYEGSVVLCVMLSIGETRGISLSGMPQVDRDLILALLPPDAPIKMSKGDTLISVEFTDTKDFVLTYAPIDSVEIRVGDDKGWNPPVKPTAIKLNFFNAVIHPQKQPGVEVPVEQDGDTVKVGSALILDQKRIQKLVGSLPHEKVKRDDEDETPRRQPVAGRNAYEIRADVLGMAIEWSSKNNSAF